MGKRLVRETPCRRNDRLPLDSNLYILIWIQFQQFCEFFIERRENRFHICSFHDQFFNNAKRFPNRCALEYEHPYGSLVRKLFDVFNTYPCSTPHAKGHPLDPKFSVSSTHTSTNDKQTASKAVCQSNKPCHFKVSNCVICHGDLLPPQCLSDEQA